MPRLRKVIHFNIDDPYWVTPAYEKNQKDPVLAKYVYEDETEYVRDQKKRRKMPGTANNSEENK